MTTSPSHSALVQMALVVAGEVYPLSHVSPTHLTLRQAVALPPGKAELVVSVNGDEDRSTIHLLSVSGDDSRSVPYREADHRGQRAAG